ncbi:MAG: methylamine dehydrogenase [Sphingomonadaceae bacterium]|nr:methylamine dehydrogenase [Sphingomonadaceae bacterium]
MMTTALIVSQVALWVVVVLLAGLNLLLLRQIGVLFERIAPAGALATTKVLAKGLELPGRTESSLTGGEVAIGSGRMGGKSQLLFFAAPDCPVCKSILPAFRSLAANESASTEFILASAGEDLGAHNEFIKAEGLGRFGYVLSDRLGMELGISKLPYAVLLDAAGKVEAFGLVNNREHLESLFEARERGVISLQQFMTEEKRA